MIENRKCMKLVSLNSCFTSKENVTESVTFYLSDICNHYKIKIINLRKQINFTECKVCEKGYLLKGYFDMQIDDESRSVRPNLIEKKISFEFFIENEDSKISYAIEDRKQLFKYTDSEHDCLQSKK